ncbi:hypothetical protein ACVDG3_18815 [Meridianimarinicoccus sp. RP-17]|uniref:hypothetical protein n=1 Tax=Meridianimarinicoccus zhengii TaxID=2056810 RepID=UPI000DAE5E2F|nr:hypothetical protein [Phycocomes zhengii]
MLRSRTPGKTLLLLGSMLALGACAVPATETADAETTISTDVMTQLSAMAAPYQDLQSVRLRSEDGCYWYRHVGPVETTMLPLRTADGRPICTQRVAEV